MKDLFRLFACAAIAGTLFSCQMKEEPFEPENEDSLVPAGYVIQEFTATSEVTKTSMDDMGKTVWSADDRIRVFWESGNASADCFSGEDSETAVFRAVIPDGSSVVYASYPEDIDVELSIAESEFEVTIPDQKDGQFANSNIAVAKVGSGNSLNFFNAGALLCIDIPGDDIKKVVVESVDGSALAGKQTLAYSGSSWTLGSQSDPKSSISMTIDGSGKKYLPILAGVTHAKGLLLKYYKDGDVLSGTYYLNKSITTERNKVYKFGEFEPDGNYYVTVDGAGKKNGLNWDNALSADKMWAMVTLTGSEATAEKAAKIAAIDGATFHMGAGTYNLAADPTISFSEASPVKLSFIGGYPAAGGTRDLASYRADFTGGDTHACLNLRGKLDVTFDGIGFVHGSVTGDNVGSLDINGTASGSDITVSMSNCLVDNNVNASYSSHADEWAAGLVLDGVTSFTADNVTFSNNKSHSASAVFIRNTTSVFTNCSFHDNSAWKDAGAVYANADVTFDSCVFEDNEAETGDAGALYAKGGHVIIDGGSFERNTAVNGGAMAIDWGNVTIEGGAVFSANEAAIGGAIYNKCDDSPALRISEDCEFNGNHATDYAGAIHYKNPGILRITDCTFSGNYAEGDSGALNIDRADCKFTRVTFTGNQAKGDAGGALWIDSGSYLFDACNFINNSSNAGTKGGGAIFADSSGNTKIMSCGFSGNKAKRGGAISAYEITDGSLFMDACWFEGNYINSSGDDNNGTTIYCLKTKKLGINNCSFKDGTYNSGDNKCDWIYIDGGSKMKELVISNCTLIGACRKSSSANCTNGSELLYVLKGSSSFEFYCINNVIISTGKSADDGMWVNGVTVKEYNNIYSSRGGSNSPTWDGSGNITDGSGNSTLSALSWDPDDHVYPWDGTGFSYTKISATTFATQIETGCSAFKSWLETEGRLNMDQLGNNRGDGSWVPGAYQPDV